MGRSMAACHGSRVEKLGRDGSVHPSLWLGRSVGDPHFLVWVVVVTSSAGVVASVVAAAPPEDSLTGGA